MVEWPESNLLCRLHSLWEAARGALTRQEQGEQRTGGGHERVNSPDRRAPACGAGTNKALAPMLSP